MGSITKTVRTYGPDENDSVSLDRGVSMSTHGEWETLCITVSGILCVKHVVKRRDLAIGIGDLQENEKKKEEMSLRTCVLFGNLGLTIG